jgi:NAD(P)-dependent dehydrogenase (short-subunit alcohol dehydrogenase family)
MAARLLLKQRHTVVLHARSEERAKHARTVLPECLDVIVGHLASIAGIETVACRANNSDAFDAIIHDAVIHNAGIGYPEPRRLDTVDGLEHLFAVNLLARYLPTAVMDPPKRLVYLSSGLHRDGIAALDDPQWAHRPWDGLQAYADSRLFDVVLTAHIAR